jgi:hypothetical protein
MSVFFLPIRSLRIQDYKYQQEKCLYKFTFVSLKIKLHESLTPKICTNTHPTNQTWFTALHSCANNCEWFWLKVVGKFQSFVKKSQVSFHGNVLVNDPPLLIYSFFCILYSAAVFFLKFSTVYISIFALLLAMLFSSLGEKKVIRI